MIPGVGIPRLWNQRKSWKLTFPQLLYLLEDVPDLLGLPQFWAVSMSGTFGRFTDRLSIARFRKAWVPAFDWLIPVGNFQSSIDAFLFLVERPWIQQTVFTFFNDTSIKLLTFNGWHLPQIHNSLGVRTGGFYLTVELLNWLPCRRLVQLLDFVDELALCFICISRLPLLILTYLQGDAAWRGIWIFVWMWRDGQLVLLDVHHARRLDWDAGWSVWAKRMVHVDSHLGQVKNGREVHPAAAVDGFVHSIPASDPSSLSYIISVIVIGIIQGLLETVLQPAHVRRAVRIVVSRCHF